MVKAIIGLALIAAAIAFGVRWATNEGTSNAPTTVRVDVPDPLGGSDGGGEEIYIP